MPEAAVNKSIATILPIKDGSLRRCTVQLLDDVAIQIEFKKNDFGSAIFDQVCDHLNLAERDYFGLRFMDHNLHRYWLDPAKPIMKQVKSGESMVFAFRVKFYPADPAILKEEFTRYLLVLQLRRDLLHGRLHCPQNDLASLASYIVQAELGDYDPNEHVGNYVSQFKILINQSPRIEEKIAQMHKSLKGQKPTEVDLNFLKKASSLDTYGYYPYTIKDSKAGQVYMGATPKGVLIYQTSRKLHHLDWPDIESMDYSGKEFYIYPQRSYFEESNTEAIKESKKKSSLKFLCPNSTFSKQMWKYMLAEKAFFTSVKSDQVKSIVKRHLLFRNSTFRWHPANRVLEELKEAKSPKRACPEYERLKIPRQVTRDERSGPWANKFHTMPARSKNPIPEGQLNSLSAPAASSSAEAPELCFSQLLRPAILRPDELSEMVTSSSITMPLAVRTSPEGSTPVISPIGEGVDGGCLPLKTASPGLLDNVMSRRGNEGLRRENVTSFLPLTSTPKVSPTDEKAGRLVTSSKITTISEITSALNGTVQEDKIPASGMKHPCAVFWRFMLLALLAAILIAALIVASMETNDEWVKGQMNEWPMFDHFRHQFYEPWRKYVCQKAQDFWK